jgi:hypothetical protein
VQLAETNMLQSACVPKRLAAEVAVLEVVESGGAIGRRGAAVIRRICTSKRMIVSR